MTDHATYLQVCKLKTFYRLSLEIIYIEEHFCTFKRNIFDRDRITKLPTSTHLWET